MTRVVVATGNEHKLREIGAILTGLDVQLVSMRAFDLPEPVEDGETFEANALLKARACAAATGLPALADDSGLEVDALGGAPGVRSARYASDGGALATPRTAQDRANNVKLVAALAGVPATERTARFVCAAAIVLPDGPEHVVRGTMAGHVIDEPRGAGGFGYDPHFVSDAAGDGRTNGELTAAEKDAISHRGAAFRALRPHVERLLGR
jgi:XTP/dITP diphosphohydrolase